MLVGRCYSDNAVAGQHAKPINTPPNRVPRKHRPSVAHDACQQGVVQALPTASYHQQQMHGQKQQHQQQYQQRPPNVTALAWSLNAGGQPQAVGMYTMCSKGCSVAPGVKTMTCSVVFYTVL